MDILIRMPNWLGDAVMATPIIKDAASLWPKASITALCQGNIGQLLQNNPYLKDITIYSKDLIKSLREKKYDLGILLTNSFSSAWMLKQAKVKKRIGFARDMRSLLLTNAIEFPKKNEHLVETYKRLLGSSSDTMPELFVNEEEKTKANLKFFIPKGAKIVGINPTAAYGPAKCWLPARFRNVIEKLLKESGICVLVFGDQSGVQVVESICKGFPSSVMNLAGKTSLRELMALISQCDAFLTNDSGPMHIAAAFQTPLVALFGSTNEIATGPYKHGKVIHKHVSCSPCYKRNCPIDFKCMKQIEVDEVYDSLKELLF